MCSHVTSQECDQRTDRQFWIILLRVRDWAVRAQGLVESWGSVSFMSLARISYRVAKVCPELYLRK